MDNQSTEALAQAWQQKYGYASCELVFGRSLLFYHPLASVEREVISESEHQLFVAMARFLARIQLDVETGEIELELGSGALASFPPSEGQGTLDRGIIYSYFV